VPEIGVSVTPASACFSLLSEIRDAVLISVQAITGCHHSPLFSIHEEEETIYQEENLLVVLLGFLFAAFFEILSNFLIE
jgi:hypothetical protein